MKIVQVIRILSVALCLSLLPSCGLISNVLKIPGRIVKSAVRTVGLNRLSDEAPQPVEKGVAGKSVKTLEQMASEREPTSE